MRLGTLFHVQHAFGHGLGIFPRLGFEELEKKEKSFFSVIFQVFFEIFFFRVDVEIWGRSIHDGSARFEQRNMPFGKSLFLKKIFFFAYFF